MPRDKKGCTHLAVGIVLSIVNCLQT